MHLTRHPRRPLLFLVAIVAVAGACGPGNQNGPTTPAASPPNPPAISPLQEFLGQGDGPRSEHARVVLSETAIARCMTERGWTYEPVMPSGYYGPPVDADAATDWAEQHGYGLLAPWRIDPDGTMRKAATHNTDVRTGLRPADLERYTNDLGGTEHDTHEPGCRDLAAAASASFPLQNPELADAALEEQGALAEHPDLVSAADDWRACMNSRGHDLPAGARSGRVLFNEAVETGQATPELIEYERAVAVADIECAVDTTWPIRTRLETEAVDALIARYGRDATCGATCPER